MDGCRGAPARAIVGRMTQRTPAVTTTGLSRTYGHGPRAVPALRDVDLVVEAGALTAVVGPPGAGKSTLLATLAGTDTAVAGRVVRHSVRLPPQDGGQRTRLRPARVGVVEPAFCLDRTLLLREALACTTSRFHDGDAALERAWWHVVLTTMGLRDRLGLTVGDLGPAERQRVALARTLLGRPDVVFVDDPAPDLDGAGGADAVACLRACVHRLGVSVVMATRDGALASCADRVVVLVGGRVVDDMVPARRRRHLAAGPRREPGREPGRGPVRAPARASAPALRGVLLEGDLVG